MKISEFVIISKAVHYLTNTFLCQNHFRTGTANVISGRTLPLILRSKIKIYGSGNRISLGSGLYKNTEIIIVGNDNDLIIGHDAKLFSSSLFIKGNHSRMIIGEQPLIHNTEIGAENDNSSVIIGDQVKIGGFTWLHDHSNRSGLTSIYSDGTAGIRIGSHCMISDKVDIRSSDSHKIYAGNRIINQPATVEIGEYCWLCSEARLLKGAGVGAHSIVGARTLLTRDFRRYRNVMLTGSPARITKENIHWEA